MGLFDIFKKDKSSKSSNESLGDKTSSKLNDKADETIGDVSETQLSPFYENELDDDAFFKEIDIEDDLDDMDLADFTIDPKEYLIGVLDTAKDCEIIDGTLIKYKGTAKNVFLPSSIIHIERGAFSDCIIDILDVPESVISMDPFAFEGVTFIKTLILPENEKRTENLMLTPSKTPNVLRRIKNIDINKSDKSQLGITIGNTNQNRLQNGIAAIQKDWIYYINKKVIYRIRANGQTIEPEQVFKFDDYGYIGNLNLVGETLFYLNYRDGSVYMMNINVKRSIKLTDDIAWFHIVDGHIYFLFNRKDPNLFGSDPLRSNSLFRSSLTSENSYIKPTIPSYTPLEYVNIERNMIYYQEDNLMKFDLNLDYAEPIIEDSIIKSNGINVYDGWVYFILDYEYPRDYPIDFMKKHTQFDYPRNELNLNPELTSTIHRIKIDGSKRQQISNVRAWRFHVDNEKIYFTNYDDDSKLYKMGIDGTGLEKVLDERTCDFNIAGNYIFYQKDGDKSSEVYIKSQVTQE